MSDWANSLGSKARERFRCRRENGRYVVPSQYVIRNVLIRIDPSDLDRSLQRWNETYGNKTKVSPSTAKSCATPSTSKVIKPTL